MRLTASDTSDQKLVVRTGSAVNPLNFCLSAQGYRQDRSDYRATLDGLKLFRLLPSLF